MFVRAAQRSPRVVLLQRGECVRGTYACTHTLRSVIDSEYFDFFEVHRHAHVYLA